MTDAEKELRRRARAEMENVPSPWVCPEDVLALLDRIEALERQAAEAERKGAEEMRDRALAEVVEARPRADRFDFAALIRSLPLPGDAP